MLVFAQRSCHGPHHRRSLQAAVHIDRHQRHRGVTLVELMIAIVIVGVLAAIAIPAYQDQVNRSRRADGQALALDIAARQERYFMQFNTYTTDITGSGGLDTPLTSREGYYTAAVAVCAAGTIATCYEVTITAVGVQASNDGDCRTLKVTDTGVKSATNAAGSASTVCW